MDSNRDLPYGIYPIQYFPNWKRKGPVKPRTMISRQLVGREEFITKATQPFPAPSTQTQRLPHPHVINIFKAENPTFFFLASSLLMAGDQYTPVC